MAQRKSKVGRPKSPDRNLASLKVPMSRQLRDRLTAQASVETKANRLGFTITAQRLAVEILDEGLARRETSVAAQ